MKAERAAKRESSMTSALRPSIGLAIVLACGTLATGQTTQPAKPGFCCADAIAAGSNRADTDGRDAPTSAERAARLLILAGEADSAGNSELANAYTIAAQRILSRAAEWHFPADNDGRVRPNPGVARARMEAGIAKCDLDAF